MILFYGDVHGRYGHILETVRKEKPAAIILLGDLEPSKPLHEELADVMALTEVYFIHGNHDSESKQEYEYVFCPEMQDRNLHGKVVEIDGHKVAGLGGVFRGDIWHPGQGSEVKYETYTDYLAHLENEHPRQYQRAKEPVKIGKALKHHSSIFYADWFSVAEQQCDILVTHEAPSCHPHGFVAIDELAQASGAKKTFHGHHHDRLNYSACFDAMGFEAHGVGLRGVSDINGAVIKIGEVDDARMHRNEKVSYDGR